MWATQATYETYYRNHQTFYCIHGHGQCYVEGKTEAQKLKEQLEEERRARQRIEQDNAYQADRRREADGRKQHRIHAVNVVPVPPRR